MRTGEDARGGRSAGIDMLRGLLVLGVIAGHCAELTQRSSFLTWLGTGVRMPLFIGLTGYLFNLERARGAPVAVLLRRYYPRLILPWLFASIVHLALTQRLDGWALLLVFVRPSFHLWFVPVMLAFMVLAAATRAAPATLLGMAIVPSIAAMYLLGVGHAASPHQPWLPDRRFFIYPIFFFYGLWVARRGRDPWRTRAALVLAPIGLLWWSSLHLAPDPYAEVAAELIWCLPLIYLLPHLRDLAWRMPALATVGRDSLFYYLWHPLLFGLWAGLGFGGVAMLVTALATLAATRMLLARTPVATVFGVVAPAGARTGWWPGMASTAHRGAST